MAFLKWSPHQAEEIELGFSQGLDEKAVSLYARHYYSAEQMALIREALVSGMDLKLASRMCRPWYSPMEMEEIYRSLLRQGKPERKLNIVTVSACLALAVLAGALITDGYIRSADYAYLNLSSPTVTLAAGEAFEPMRYVSDYSDHADSLVLPVTLDTSSPGRKAAVYRLKQGREEITRIMIVEVTE